LIVFFRTSRPHLSPPKGSVALRSTGFAVAFDASLFRISAITSASGSTDGSSALGAAAGGGVATASPGVRPAFNASITSPMGSTMFDLY
jgi:hypothetical protein